MSNSFLSFAVESSLEKLVAAISDYVEQRDGVFETADKVVEYEQYSCKNKRLLGVLEKKIAVLYLKLYELDGWVVVLDDEENSWDYSTEILQMLAVLSVKLNCRSCFLNFDEELELMHCSYFDKGEVIMQCKKRYDLNDLYEENINVRKTFELLNKDNPHGWDIMEYEDYLKLSHEERDKHYPYLCMALLPFDLFRFEKTDQQPEKTSLYKFATN